MKDLVTSEVTGKTYDPSKCIRILNSLQCAKYMKHRCFPVDIYPSIDYKTGQDVLVYIFERNDQNKELYQLWCDHKL